MRRIAIFASAFHPSLGGVEELVRQLVVHLQERDCEMLVCTNQWPRHLHSEELVDGIEVWRFPFRVPWGGFRAKASFPVYAHRTLTDLCARLRGWGAELIHVQCISTNGWYAKEASRILGVPLLLTSQGERTMDASGVYQRSVLFNRMLRSCLRQAQRITACSRSVLEDLQAYYGEDFGERAEVVYNGVGDEAFLDGPKWPHPNPYLLAFGRLVPQKGFSVLLHAYAAAKIQGVDLLLAGDGPELQDLSSLRDQLGLRDRVHFVGRACRRIVGELIRGCRGLVVPSIREPMGIVALEGMAMGKPLVVSRVDGLIEFTREGTGCKQVPPGDIPLLAEALCWLSSEAPEYVRIHVIKANQMRWRALSGQYKDIYDGMLAPVGGAGGLVPA
ncbi:MAG: glycosyltransferase family 4 protein [Verrucomicrobiota bacterium]